MPDRDWNRRNQPEQSSEHPGRVRLGKPESNPGGVAFVDARSRAGQRAGPEESRAAGAHSEMGSWRQGQRPGQSRSADGGTDQGVGESAGHRVGGREPGCRARIGCADWAGGPREWAPTAASSQAGWSGLGAVGSVSGSSRAGRGGLRSGCGRAAGRSSRAGFSGSSTIDPRLVPGRIGAATGVDFPLRAVVLDGAADVFGLATPAGAPDGRFFRQPAGQWPAGGAYAASRRGPTP